MGKEISRQSDLPLYIHLGQLWPTKDNKTVDADELVRELVPLMEAGDVLAHPFTRHPGGFVCKETAKVHPVVWEALDRGVTIDVGHGSHFSFEMAKLTLDAGIRPTTLGADMHGLNVSVPQSGVSESERKQNPFYGVAPFNLTIAMTELLALGLELSEVVATVTSNPAQMLGLEDQLGTLQPGYEADISVLELLNARFKLTDNSGSEMMTEQLLQPVFCLRSGRRIEADSPLIPDVELMTA